MRISIFISNVQWIAIFFFYESTNANIFFCIVSKKLVKLQVGQDVHGIATDILVK